MPQDILYYGRTTELKVVAGQVTTVTASDTIATGLRKVLYAVAVLEDAPVAAVSSAQAAVGDQAGTPAAGSILIKTWKATASGDTTPLAASTFGKKVNYFAVGY
jgi:hypothetical protein